jgi:hypothetical protein
MAHARLLIGGVLASGIALTLATLTPAAQVRLQIATPAPSVPEPVACGAPTRADADNGIATGDPKVFDNRSLALMLDSLNESLRGVQVVDAKSLAASLNLLQGFQQDSIARSFSLQGAPLPGVTDTARNTLQETNSEGTTASSGSTTQPANTTTSSGGTTNEGTTANQERTVQTTTGARTPMNPELPATLPSPAFAPQFGFNAGDQLADQVNLTYQIFNVRMLLERSLTDRLWTRESRLQAILGFNVSIDPPRDSQDSAAFVEVTVSRRDNPTQPVSVVALMPQEKTYNSAALSNRSTAFGGSAVSQVFSVGYNERRQSQTFYLFRDNDTIAFERMQANPAQTKFGWAFRPVLGRRSVSPGSRQMFAVISLPDGDTTNGEVPLTVSVRTFWRHYDRGTLTTSNSRTFWQNVARITSLATAQDRPQGGAATTTSCVMVPTTLRFQQDLQPQIDALRWRQTDNSTALVTVRGRNFFQGTSVRLGNKAFATPADGFALKSDQTFDMIVPVTELLGDGVVIGRYGNAIDMIRPDVSADGMEIQRIAITPPIGGRRVIDVILSGPHNSSLSLASLAEPPIASLGNTIIPPPYELRDVGGQVGLQLYAAVETFPTAEGLLTVRFPFSGDKWRRTARINDPSLALSVTRYGAEKDTTKILISTTDQANLVNSGCAAGMTWRVTLGAEYPVGPALPPAATPGAAARSPQLVEFRAPNDDVEKHPLLVRDCADVVHRLSMPSAPNPTPERVEFGSLAPSTVKINSAQRVVVTGKLLNRVASITANDLRLASRPTKATELEVFLERGVTKDGGIVTLVGRDDRGVILASIDLTIQ